MTRGALAAFVDGVGRVNGAPAVLGGVWLMLLAVSLPPALLMRATIEDHLGASLEADLAARGVNYDWMIEFNQQATQATGPLSPSVIGFAAVLDNFSALLDREPRALLVILTGVASLALWVLLAGGILDRYARARPIWAHGFFSASGTFFFRFLRLGVFAGVAYGLLFGVLHPWLFGGVYEGLTRETTVERTAFLIRVGLYLVFGAMLAGVGLLFDYAKVRAVVEDRRSMAWALASSVRFLWQNAGAAVPLYLVNLALAGVVIAAYAAVAPGAGWTGLSMWTGFAISQIYVLGRLWAKLVCWASETALFQQRLAHAGYVARAAPKWPDSANVEALGL